MTRPKTHLLVVGGIIAVQLALIFVYRFVEADRSREDQSLGTAPPERVNSTLPALTLVRRDGSSTTLGVPKRRTLLHVWATWCPPCRDELPALLALPNAHDVDVIAIALDDSWAPVNALFAQLPALAAAGVTADDVLLASSNEVERSLAITTLPVTLVVEPDGRIPLRFDGARDWSDVRLTRIILDAAGPR